MPIKRSTALIPLSHDHHHGLAWCRRMQRDLAAGTPSHHLVSGLRKFWDEELFEHFKEEEELLFSLMPPGDIGVSRALEEHQQLKRILAELDDSNPATPALLSTFAALLHDHIRFEERELFPVIEATLSIELLEAAGKEVIRRHRKAD